MILERLLGCLLVVLIRVGLGLEGVLHLPKGIFRWYLDGIGGRLLLYECLDSFIELLLLLLEHCYLFRLLFYWLWRWIDILTVDELFVLFEDR